MRPARWSLLTALLAGLLAGSSGGPARADEARVEALLQSLDLESKVGQLLMVGFGGREMGPEIERLLKGLHIGAVALYTRNIQSAAQAQRLIREVRKVMSVEVQPLLAIDQEGGNVVRVHHPLAVLPGAMTLGATRDPMLAYLVGQAVGTELRLLGFDMNLAPVLDINHNPKNPVINVRAFGDEAGLVAVLGTAYITGQQEAGLATVAKHFPGHGTTAADSHFSLPRIEAGLEELETVDLVPFRQAIAAGLDAVMTAHVQVPAVEPDGTPGSLSARVVHDLLREKLGFEGLVITDDLEMRAISGELGVGEAAVRAVLAGADMVMVIWTPRRKTEVAQALLGAVRAGRISPARLDESVRRILRLKDRLGTLDARGSPRAELGRLLPNRRHQQLTWAVAVRGLTLVRNEGKLLPLCQGQGVLVASPLQPFRKELQRLLPGLTSMELHIRPSDAQRQRELARLLELAPDHRALVVGVHNAYQAWLVQELVRRTRVPVVAVSFASPYYLRNFPRVAGYVCTYSYLPAAQVAAAQALTGRGAITGRLPVAVSAGYPRGAGLSLPRGACRERLSLAPPSAGGVHSKQP
jgi:beta-N-acetylhexosaminidase